MPFFSDSIETPHEMAIRMPDGRDLLFLSGYAVFNFIGNSGEWRRDELRIPVGPEWIRIDEVVPVVSLASITNLDVATNAGWAVDNCQWSNVANSTTGRFRILLACQVGIRDRDGYLQRVAYQVTALGQLH